MLPQLASPALATVECRLAQAVLLFVPIAVAYSNINLGWLGKLGSVLTIAIGIMAAWIIYRSARLGGLSLQQWRPAGMTTRTALTFVLAAGLALHFAVLFLTMPIPQSDGRTYLGLAERILANEPYIDAQGRRAFFPPGLPLFLTPFVGAFGSTPTTVGLANAVLYLVGAWALWSLTRRLFGEGTALWACILYTLWPSRLLLAGVAAKELLTMAAVTASIALAAQAIFHESRRAFALSLLGGVAIGIAMLAQPGLLLLLLVYPLMFRGALVRIPARRLAALLAAAFLGAAVVVTPWMARNCVVFSGEFCGLASNGGVVFYQANNPLATGLWTPTGAVSLKHLPEQEQSKRGFELGKQWILENPVGAAKLAAYKLVFLLGTDDHGAYWAVKRGDGKSDTDPGRIGTPREKWFQGLRLVSNLWWLLITGLAFKALHNATRRRSAELPKLLPFIYPLLYSAAVFSVFESGDRQHFFTVPLLLGLAACALVPPVADADRKSAAQRG